MNNVTWTKLTKTEADGVCWVVELVLEILQLERHRAEHAGEGDQTVQQDKDNHWTAQDTPDRPGACWEYVEVRVLVYLRYSLSEHNNVSISKRLSTII